MDLSQQSQVLEKVTSIVTRIPFNHLLGLTLEHLYADHIVMSFSMKDELIGNFLHGILHGGVISSVLDMAGGLAAMAGAMDSADTQSEQALTDLIGKCSTIDLQINFLRPGKGERFLAKAWLVKHGKKISFCRMELCNQDETLIAMGTGTYLLNSK